MILEKLFRTNFQKHIERKARVENEVEVLKTQQKVKSEAVIANFESKKIQFSNNTDAEITTLEKQIENLKASKTNQICAFEKELVVELKKVDNEFDAKILAKQNEIKKLTNLIEKEQKDMRDLVNPLKSNAPKNNRRILNESKK